MEISSGGDIIMLVLLHLTRDYSIRLYINCISHCFDVRIPRHQTFHNIYSRPPNFYVQLRLPLPLPKNQSFPTAFSWFHPPQSNISQYPISYKHRNQCYNAHPNTDLPFNLLFS